MGEVKVYFDNNASTPIDPNVIVEMEPFIRQYYGNPSSGHWFGKKGREAVDTARRQVAELIGASPHEIIFTSGGSESNNHALKGVAFALKGKGNHIVTSVVEHPAIINPCKYLETKGFKVTYVGVDEYGCVNADDIEEAIIDETVLVSVMHANNETGTIQPIAEISKICRKRGIYFHSDTAQSVGKIPVDVNELGVDLLTIAGHKFHAPKGVGALYIREGVDVEPLIHGASHEMGLRAGTENVAGVVGLGKASLMSAVRMDEYIKNIRYLRDLLHEKLKGIAAVKLNGHPTQRLPNTLNVSFEGIDSSALVSKLEDVALSTGAACHDQVRRPSTVLTAMNIPAELAMGAVRFSLGRFNTEDEVNYVVDEIKRVMSEIGIKKMRGEDV
ncbi:MAG: cysteine desulfurase NifS [Candidatus Kuenenia stuttgartiensis]|nr:MAG: cysteine desulfurase NifS [Candidatus Kuenenia stuttgartiensis]